MSRSDLLLPADLVVTGSETSDFGGENDDASDFFGEGVRDGKSSEVSL